jgi:hypothetical protein
VYVSPDTILATAWTYLDDLTYAVVLVSRRIMGVFETHDAITMLVYEMTEWHSPVAIAVQGAPVLIGNIEADTKGQLVSDQGRAAHLPMSHVTLLQQIFPASLHVVFLNEGTVKNSDWCSYQLMPKPDIVEIRSDVPIPACLANPHCWELTGP